MLKEISQGQKLRLDLIVNSQSKTSENANGVKTGSKNITVVK